MLFRTQKRPPAIAPGTYPAIVEDVTASKYDPEKRLDWTITIRQNGYSYEAKGTTTNTFWSGSRERQWASNILGHDLQDDEDLRSEELIGAAAKVTISTKLGRDGLTMFYNIVDILPPDAGQAAQAESLAPASEHQDNSDVPF